MTNERANNHIEEAAIYMSYYSDRKFYENKGNSVQSMFLRRTAISDVSRILLFTQQFYINIS
jgi:hypothetical protein